MIISKIDLRNFVELLYKQVLPKLEDSTDPNQALGLLSSYSNDALGKVLKRVEIYLTINDISIYEACYFKQLAHYFEVVSIRNIKSNTDMKEKLNIKGTYPEISAYIARLSAAIKMESKDFGMSMTPLLMTRCDINMSLSGFSILDCVGTDNINMAISTLERRKIINDEEQLKNLLSTTFINISYERMDNIIKLVDPVYFNMMVDTYWKYTKRNSKYKVDVLRVYSRYGSLRFIDSDDKSNATTRLKEICGDGTDQVYIEFICNLSYNTVLLLKLFSHTWFSHYDNGNYQFIDIDYEDIKSNRLSDVLIDVSKNVPDNELIKNLHTDEFGTRKLINTIPDKSPIYVVQTLPANLATRCIVKVLYKKELLDSQSIFFDKLKSSYLDLFENPQLEREVKLLWDKIVMIHTLLSSI